MHCITVIVNFFFFGFDNCNDVVVDVNNKQVLLLLKFVAASLYKFLSGV